MSGTQTSMRPRRKSRVPLIVALVLSVALIASVVIAAMVAIGGVREQGYLGGAIVVPEKYRSLIKDAAERCDAVPVEVFAAQIAAESGWDPEARSPAGARGIAQFMPEVWKQYGIDGNDDGNVDVFDAEDAIHSAAEMNCLNRRLVRDVSGNRLRNTIAAYNAGFNAVRKYDGVPPFPETEAYVAKIFENAKTIVL
jgi:soluble lytic murein transglycosylase-like protein